MLQTIKAGLQKGPKSKLLFEAMVYSSLVNITRNNLGLLYPDFGGEFKSLKIFYKSSPEGFEVRLVSNNIPFLSWMKTECEALENEYYKHLQSKNLITENQKISLKFTGK